MNLLGQGSYTYSIRAECIDKSSLEVLDMLGTVLHVFSLTNIKNSILNLQFIPSSQYYMKFQSIGNEYLPITNVDIHLKEMVPLSLNGDPIHLRFTDSLGITDQYTIPFSNPTFTPPWLNPPSSPAQIFMPAPLPAPLPTPMPAPTTAPIPPSDIPVYKPIAQTVVTSPLTMNPLSTGGSKSGSYGWIWLLLIVLAVLLIGLGYYLNKQKSKQPLSTVNIYPDQTVMDLV